MFGGTGLYCDDVFIGIIARDRLYLKVDESNRPDYERHGMKAFKPPIPIDRARCSPTKCPYVSSRARWI